MTLKGQTIAILILTSCLVFSGLAPAAEEPGPPLTSSPIITDSAVPIAQGSLAVEPFWSLSFVRGNFSPSWRPVSARGNFASFEPLVRLTYGPARNTEVYVTLPYLHNWASQVEAPGLPGAGQAQFDGLGDIFATVKYQLLSETRLRPTVTGLFAVTFPTGHHFRLNPGNLGQDALGGGVYDFTLGFNLSKWVRPIYLYANLWYSISAGAPGRIANQQAGPLLPAVHGRDLLTVNLAGEWVISPRWVILLELYSTWEVGSPYSQSSGPPAALLGILPGLELILSSHWTGALGVAVDVAGKNSASQVTPMLTMTYTF